MEGNEVSICGRCSRCLNVVFNNKSEKCSLMPGMVSMKCIVEAEVSEATKRAAAPHR